MGKKTRALLYFLGGLIFISFLVLNTYTSILAFEFVRGKVEEFYQKDFVDVKTVSEQLVRDIEKSCGRKLPPVELNIRLLEYSETGIQYNGKVLQLFLPPKIIVLNNDQKRAYMAHEFGHYVLGHTNHQNPSIDSFLGQEGNIDEHIKADSFALIFSKRDSLEEVIKELVWDENQKNIRLAALDRS